MKPNEERLILSERTVPARVGTDTTYSNFFGHDDDDEEDDDDGPKLDMIDSSDESDHFADDTTADFSDIHEIMLEEVCVLFINQPIKSVCLHLFCCCTHFIFALPYMFFVCVSA